MKKIASFVIFIFLVFQPIFGEARDFYPKIFADINREMRESVVKISIRSDLDDSIIKGFGAGFSIGKGLIVTACHVVIKKEPAPDIAIPDITRNVVVETSSGKIFPAEIVAVDVSFDVAIIKIKGDTSFFLKPLKFGDSSKIEQGDFVMTIGHPLAMGWSLSVGVISAIRNKKHRRHIGYADIQADIAVNPGNSGGPLFNLDGEVIGIVIAKGTGAEGISFATPSNTIKEVFMGVLEAPAQKKIK